MEFLNINIGSPSLIVFFAHVFLIIGILFMIVSPSLFTFSIMFFSWVLSTLSFLFYGIYTEEVGFIYLAIFDMLLLFFGLFVRIDSRYDEDVDQ